MARKKYKIKSACPQCGCSYLKVLTPEEIKEKFGDVPNVELECHECLMSFEEEMKTACPEWDEECRMNE